MSSFKIFDIAGSGMNAQNLRMNVVASNLANVDAVSSSTGATYRARQPIFQAVLDQANAAGPAVGVQMAPSGVGATAAASGRIARSKLVVTETFP